MYSFDFIWRFPEIGVPLVIIHLRLGFSTINHPFWGTPIYGNHLYIHRIYLYIFIYLIYSDIPIHGSGFKPR